MKDQHIELPPLPTPFGIVDPDGTEGMMQYTTKDLQDYAKAYALSAIEADRKKQYRPVYEEGWKDALEWADRQRRGEPVAWVKQDIAENQFINMRPRRIWWECNEGIGMPIFAAPQPAEPVKVPSDDLAHEIWAAAQTAPGEGIEDAVERVAALLARYGATANPESDGSGREHPFSSDSSVQAAVPTAPAEGQQG